MGTLLEAIGIVLETHFRFGFLSLLVDTVLRLFFISGSLRLGPCLVPKKFYKIFQISRHIESLDACMEY